MKLLFVYPKGSEVQADFANILPLGLVRALKLSALHLKGMGLDAFITALDDLDVRSDLAGRSPLVLHDERVDGAVTGRMIEPFDAVLISGLTFQAPRMYEIARLARQRGVQVILGGVHASTLTDEARQYGAVVKGRAESVIPGSGRTILQAVLADLAAGQWVEGRAYEGMVPDLRTMPLPVMDYADLGLERKRFMRVFPVEASWGCSYGCDFCATPAFTGRHHLVRSVDQVVAEIQGIQRLMGKRRVFVIFTDENFTLNPDYALKLCHALEPLGIIWNAQISKDAAERPGLIEAMGRSGCVCAFLGSESAEEEALREISKERNLKGVSWDQALRLLHRNGIGSIVSLIAGFDSDRPGLSQRTYRYWAKRRAGLVQWGYLTPVPGTPLMERLVRAGRVVPGEELWAQCTSTEPILATPNLSLAQIKAERTMGLRRFFSWRGIAWRLLCPPTLLFANLRLRRLPMSFAVMIFINLQFRRVVLNEIKEDRSTGRPGRLAPPSLVQRGSAAK